MSYTGSEELGLLELGAPRYNSYLVARFRNKLTEYGFQEFRQVLDFGAGIGTLAQIWRDQYGIEVDCLEIDQRQQQVLVDRGFRVQKDVLAMRNRFEVVYLSNVLEHIEDDVSILQSIRKYSLKQNGMILVYVPAFQFLFSPLDEKLRHFRRYSRSSLTRTLEQAGYSVLHVEFVDSLGIIGWIIQKYLSKFSRRTLSNVKLVAIYDTAVLPISLLLDRLIFSRFAGKNLLIIGKKEEKAASSAFR